MNIKVSVAKKIMCMVLLPVLLICIVIGLVCAIILNRTVTNEIETQLRIAAYNFKSEYELLGDDKTEIANAITIFHTDNDIDITIFGGEDNVTRVYSSIDDVIGTKMSDDVFSHIMHGDSYFATNADVNGDAYFGYYIPIMDNGTYIAASFAGISRDNAQQLILHSVMRIIIYVLLCGIFAISVSYLFIRKIVGGIKRLEHTVGSLLENDLSVEHEKYDRTRDEIEDLCNKTVDFSKQLGSTVYVVQSAADDLQSIVDELNEDVACITETSSQMAQAVENVASGAVLQANETTGATHKVSDMSENISYIKSDIGDLRVITDSMKQTKSVVTETLANLITVNGNIMDDVSLTNNQMNVTNESVMKIQQVVDVIKDIASETKLLSLNASIEAAKAGDAGRGFSVVAENIRILAEQSAKSSSDIEHILSELDKNYGQMIHIVGRTVKGMDIQSKNLSDVEEAFHVLEQDVDSTVTKIDDISSMVVSLDDETKSIVDMISNLSAISEENSASAEETMAGIQEMKASIHMVHSKTQNVGGYADNMRREVSVFKTNRS